MKKSMSGCRSLFNFALCIVLLSCLFFSCVIPVSASDFINSTIKQDEVWQERWESSVQSVTLELDVDETGLYHLCVKDHKKTALFFVYLTDTVTGEQLGYIAPQDITEVFITAGILLFEVWRLSAAQALKSPLKE